MVPWSARRKIPACALAGVFVAGAGLVAAAVAVDAGLELLLLLAAYAMVPAPTRTAPANARPAIFLPSDSFISMISFSAATVAAVFWSQRRRQL
jgi:hypothetical protein